MKTNNATPLSRALTAAGLTELPSSSRELRSAHQTWAARPTKNGTREREVALAKLNLARLVEADPTAEDQIRIWAKFARHF